MKAEADELEKRINTLNQRSRASLRTENKLLSGFGTEQRQALYQILAEILTPEVILKGELPENLKAFCFLVARPKVQSEKKPYILLCDEDEEYMVEMGNSTKGNARRVLNFMTSFTKARGKINKSIVETMRRQQTLRHAINHPDDTNQFKLREREAELSRLKALLQSDLEKEE